MMPFSTAIEGLGFGVLFLLLACLLIGVALWLIDIVREIWKKR